LDDGAQGSRTCCPESLWLRFKTISCVIVSPSFRSLVLGVYRACSDAMKYSLRIVDHLVAAFRDCSIGGQKRTLPARRSMLVSYTSSECSDRPYTLFVHLGGKLVSCELRSCYIINNLPIIDRIVYSTNDTIHTTETIPTFALWVQFQNGISKSLPCHICEFECHSFGIIPHSEGEPQLYP